MSYSVGKIHKYSVDLYQKLEEETGQPVSFLKRNLRLARSQERMDELGILEPQAPSGSLII